MACYLWKNSAQMRQRLLLPIQKVDVKPNQPLEARAFSFNARPAVPWLGEFLFCKKALLHHYGCIPLVVITVIGFTCEVLYWIHNAGNRDDVYYTKTANCDIIETRKGYPVAIRKNLVINQKCEVPRGLLLALQGDTEGQPDDGDAQGNSGGGVGVKQIVAHAAVSALTIGIAMLI